MKQLKYLLILVLSLFTLNVFAAPTAQDAQATLERQAERILGELKANKALYSSNPRAFQSFIDRTVSPNLAFDVMARYALGNHRKTVEGQGKFIAFRNALKDLLIRQYSNGWKDYTNATLTVSRVDAVKNNRTRITAVVNNNGTRNNMEFMLCYENGVWKVWDAKFSNYSIMTGHRNTFDKSLREKGVDAVIAEMKYMN